MESANNTGFNSMAKSSNRNTQMQTAKEQMICKLDNILNKYMPGSNTFIKELEPIIKQLRRKRKEFDATRFFVLVVGPVKSGKSTLVNIFARKYVSPTAYRECTALPTIIGKSNGEHLNKIIQYFPTDEFNSDEAKKETFDYIVDVIREIENKDILNGRVTSQISDLNVENIKNIITLFYDDGYEKDDLVVSLGIEGGGFIDDEIMLIDMPGLDGCQKHQDNTLVYSNMAQRADAVFFVQSTTSAINKGSIDFLNTLFKDKKGKVPVWLIHNLHESQYFLNDDNKKNTDLEEQINIGRKRIEEGFGIKRFAHEILNLGKINTAINESDRIKPKNQEEVDLSLKNYLEFERNLTKTLKEERQKIKDEINIGKAIDEIDKSITNINEHINIKNHKKATIQNNITKAKALSKLLDNVQIFDVGFLSEYDKLIVAEDIKHSWEVKINEIFDNNRPISDDKIEGVELKEKIDKIIEECTDAIPIKNGTQFRIRLSNSLCNEITTPLKDTINKIETCFNGLFNGNEKYFNNIDIYQLIDKYLKVETTKIPSFYSDIRENLRINFIRIHFNNPIASKKYNKKEHGEYLDAIKSYIINTQIQNKLDEYKGIIKDDFKTIRDSYIAQIKEATKNKAKEYETRQNVILQKIENEIELLNAFIKDLNA